MGESVRFIYLIKPLMFLIPKIPKPNKDIKRQEKFIWTSIILFIFLICSQIPLYGIYKSEGSDPIYWMRAILASSRGTLMDGIRYISFNYFINDNASFSRCKNNRGGSKFKSR